ncbi:MAG: TIGR01777 family oxidoreductase [Bacteroidota bacterium]|jgi:uncharacterized protein (TIGR01777 family)
MKVIIAGGSGLVGRKLIEELLRGQHVVTMLSRRPERTEKIFPRATIKFWDAKTNDGLTDVLEGADAVINLTGESIAAKRWTHIQKERILSSRIESTQALVDAIKQTKRKPSVLLNASAVGYYGNVPESEVTEASPRGAGFLADVCALWEVEALKVREFGVRVVLLRTGIVLDKNGSALQKLLLPFRLFIGGPLGSGKQWFPWIHLQDEVRAILFAMENEHITGSINLAAPESVRMMEFCRKLGKILHRPSWVHVPAFVLKCALGEMAEPLLLDGQKVIPQKLIDARFEFQFPKLEDALRDLLT